MNTNQDRLLPNDGLLKRVAGKRHIVLIETMDVKAIHPFKPDRAEYEITDDRLLVERIEKVKIQ